MLLFVQLECDVKIATTQQAKRHNIIMAEQDEMENNWGCDLIRSSVTGHCTRTKNQLDAKISSEVPGFQLEEMEINGSKANFMAIIMATMFDFSRCLFGMGCYSGGTKYIEDYSSSDYDEPKSRRANLAIPCAPEDVTTVCRNQTIAMPYHVPSANLDDVELEKREMHCLDELHKKLFRAKLVGTPFKAFLLELILCGNGGELSERFLTKLGILFAKYNVSIIVDEVMTAGRVGPSLAMTSRTPDAFRSQVKYITMGKITDCGLVLSAKPPKPANCDSGLRGVSTTLECGEAFQQLSCVLDRLKEGRPESRRKEVLALMSLDEENIWGRGCLIFSTKSRPGVKKGLKNRMLPMLENVKLRKGATKDSKWTRSSLNDYFKMTTNLWLAAMHDSDSAFDPFGVSLVDYMWQPSVEDVRAEDLMKFVGEKTADWMATTLRNIRREKTKSRNGVCDKTAMSFIVEALGKASANAPELMKRSRVGSKRTLVYQITRSNMIVSY